MESELIVIIYTELRGGNTDTAFYIGAMTGCIIAPMTCQARRTRASALHITSDTM